MLTNNEIPLERRVDLSEGERYMWRSLIRVASIDEDNLGLLLPSSTIREVLYFELAQLPEDIRRDMHEDYRFHAKVNTGVENPADIYIDLFSYEKR